MPKRTSVKTTISKSALLSILLGSLLVGGCEFSNKSNLLTPTAPSGSGSSPSSGSSGSTSSGGSSSSSSSGSSSGSSTAPTPAASGTWTAPNISGVPNIGSCTNLQWQISSMSSTAVAGSISTVCGGVVT